MFRPSRPAGRRNLSWQSRRRRHQKTASAPIPEPCLIPMQWWAGLRRHPSSLAATLIATLLALGSRMVVGFFRHEADFP